MTPVARRSARCGAFSKPRLMVSERIVRCSMVTSTLPGLWLLSMAEVAQVQAMAERARSNVERVIVGKSNVIDLVLVALLCEGHLLIEDVPGIGKTMLAK